MSAPYWGQLPPLKVTRQDSGKRAADPSWKGKDLSVNTNVRGDPLSRQMPSQPQPAQNRNSTQTEAPTTSTLSPFASPTASSFRGEGLAPRPTSFPYGGIDPYNNDYLEKRRRRESRNREQIYSETTAVPPPAAPDAPRPLPPASYNQRNSFGASSSSRQAPARSKSTRRSEGPVSPSKAAPEDYYRSGSRDEYPAVDNEVIQSRQGTARRSSSKGNAAVGNEAVGWSREKPERLDSSQSQPMKGSVADSDAQRRREWAPDRSPLQRLELTLDSITKEEKRARVEEAELLAREAKAGRGGERANQNSVRFRNRPPAKAPESGSQPEPQTLPEAGLVRNLSNKQRDQLQRSGTVEKRRYIPPEVPPTSGTGRDFDYGSNQEGITDTRNPSTVSMPQREPSVRETSVAPVQTAIAGTIVGAGLARSASKLKKDPPGDPWYNRRAEAERKYQEVVPRRPSTSDRKEAVVETSAPSKGTAFTSHPQTSKDLPVLANQGRQAPEGPIDKLELDSEEDMDPKPVRRGTSRKIEQLTGEKAPVHGPARIPSSQPQPRNLGQFDGSLGIPNQPGDNFRTEPVSVNGIKYTAPPTSADSYPREIPAGQGAESRHHFSNLIHRGGHETAAGEGVYTPSRRLDEWKKGGVALLSGTQLDLEANDKTAAEQDKAWWEAGPTRKRKSISTKQRKAEAYDGEYDNSNAPTRFKPPLFLKSGPLLRYCGLRRERLQGSFSRNAKTPEREIWRGSVMIVTHDADSSYELAPTLRLFLQPMDLLPPPPAQVDGGANELAPEYVDPIAGLPKIGRDGRTLYVRPVEHLDEEKDLSREESDEGLFEMQKSPVDSGARAGHDGSKDTKAILTGRSQKTQFDGEKAGKYKEVRGFRLHAERGVTFWRFNLEVELRDKQQRIAYRINRGPATGFWVPARNQAMNIMFHSCNGFSLSVNPDQFCGPDPMWRDVLNTHQTQPFHVMIGGGDQIYNDAVMEQTTIFKQWLEIKNPLHKENTPLTQDMQNELETFYLDRYSMWFSQGLFSLANSQIPMINVFDDHDIIDGFGSYSDHYMSSPIMSGLGAIAFKYYMLFQHQSSIDEGEASEPSWILGTQPGPYIPELSRSIFTHLGRSIALLGLDCRTERMNDEIVSAETYHKVFDRLEKDIVKGETKHLIVLLGVPIAYPRMVWLENILTSRLMTPVKALGRTGILGKGLLNHLDGGVEVLDDLDDHWTAKNHKAERNWLIQELQDLAAEKSVRVTILGGDVHLAAIGQFYSNPKLGIPKDLDHRYMPNIISSAIVNTPPPDMLADILNKRNKVHHLDRETDEDMIPVFTHDVNGKLRKNKRLLNRRNWCSIREYNPDLSPPPTPQTPSDERDPTATKGGVLTRLSTSRGPSYRPDAAPPISSAGFFSRRQSTSRRGSTDSERPGTLTRTLSLSRKDFLSGGIFRRNSKHKPDDGGINGYGAGSEDDVSHHGHSRTGTVGIRGGSGGDDDSYFSPRAPTGHSPEYSIDPTLNSMARNKSQGELVRTQFHRTPTNLSEKQRKRGGRHEINLEGGLDICLNLEISPKDPAGITMPYRLLVPALWYQNVDEKEEKPGGGLKRLISFRRRKSDGESGERK